jgi:multicomponent K+:H+ antiporter subunit G
MQGIPVSDIAISFFLVVSGIFGLVGSFGLIKLDNPMARLHGPTKATTLGVGGVLIASMLYFLLEKGQFSFHELLITIFLFVTAPVTAHFIAKAHLHRNETPETLPDTGTGRAWASYEPDDVREAREADASAEDGGAGA